MLLSASLAGCSGDKYSKKLICENLYSGYNASLSYVISDSEQEAYGSADITKSDKTVLLFKQPQEYSGISITSDSAYNPDIFIFELSGIPANVPKSIAGDLTLMFSLFSDVIPSKLSQLSQDCFSISEADGSVSAEFEENGMQYRINYNQSTGYPTSLSVGNDKSSVLITIEEFKTIKND